MADHDNTPRSGPWECGICCDEFDAPQDKPIEIEGDTVCRECIRGKFTEEFERALANEFDPVRWGETILDADDFADILDPQLLVKWSAVKIERGVPLNKRVYCRHKVPDTASVEAGVAALHLEGDSGGESEATRWTECANFISELSQAEKPIVVGCFKCHGLVCRTCKAAIVPDATHDSCEATVQSPTTNEAFSELQRGRHWQECPNCSLKVERSDGCNHMTCPSCQENYCMICGVRAAGDSGHWQRSVGNCPKYNHPDDANALFEDDMDDEDEADEADNIIEPRYQGEFFGSIDWTLQELIPNSDAAFATIDDVAITEDMVDKTPLTVMEYHTLKDSRKTWLADWSRRAGHGLDRWTLQPPAYVEAKLCTYRIMRMLVELSNRTPEFDVTDALTRYDGYWERLQELKASFPPTLEEGSMLPQALLNDDLELFEVEYLACDERKVEVIAKLFALSPQRREITASDPILRRIV